MAPSRETIVRVGWSGVKTAAFVALLIAVAAFLLHAFPSAVGADHSFIVQTGSMEPAILTGSTVFVSETPFDAVETGDVVTYTDNGGNFVTHRVVEVHEAGETRRLVTKGDANENPDPEPVYRGDFLGTVPEWPVIGLATLPFVGHVVRFGSTPIGWTFLVVIPLVLLVTAEVWSLYVAATSEPEEA